MFCLYPRKDTEGKSFFLRLQNKILSEGQVQNRGNNRLLMNMARNRVQGLVGGGVL